MLTNTVNHFFAITDAFIDAFASISTADQNLHNNQQLPAAGTFKQSSLTQFIFYKELISISESFMEMEAAGNSFILYLLYSFIFNQLYLSICFLDFLY